MLTDTLQKIAVSHAGVVALHAMNADDPGFDAENQRVRLAAEAVYEMPVVTATEKAAMAAFVLAYEGDGIEPAVIVALRSIAA